MVRDRINRPLEELRISLIDACNMRCRYCMPIEEKIQFSSPASRLTLDEYLKILQAMIPLGLSSLRFTGGEPLINKNSVEWITEMAALHSWRDLSLTTNGVFLDQFSDELTRAGIKRINVSLDSLNPENFKRITGSQHNPIDIYKQIIATAQKGFRATKVNMVVQKGINDHEVVHFVEKFRNTGVVLRFIEYMDVGTLNHWDLKQVTLGSEIITEIDKYYDLERLSPNKKSETADRWRLKDDSLELGFVNSISKPFCQNCNRARLSVEGLLYPCLFAVQGLDLKQLIRKDRVSAFELQESIASFWSNRDDRYSEIRQSESSTSPTRVEMFKVGG